MSLAPNDATTLLQAALAKVEPADRAAFLEEACGGDAVLRCQVEALWLAHDNPDLVLGGHAAAPPIVDPPAEEQPRPFSGGQRSRLAARLVVGGLLILIVAGAALGLLVMNADRQRLETALVEKSVMVAQTQVSLDAEKEAHTRTRDALTTVADGIIPDPLGQNVHLGKKDKAFLRQVQRGFEELGDERGKTETTRALAADGLFRVGLIRAFLAEPAPAADYFQRAARRYEQLAKEFPDAAAYQKGLVKCLSHLGMIQEELGKLAAAEAAFRQAIVGQEKLARDFPDDLSHQEKVARSQYYLGQVLKRQGKWSSAAAAYRNVILLQGKMIIVVLRQPWLDLELAESYTGLAQVLMALGRSSKALTACRRGLELHESQAEALDACRRGLELHEHEIIDFCDRPANRNRQADSYTGLAAVLNRLGKRSEALQAYHNALALQSKLSADFPAVADYRHGLAITQFHMGNLLTQSRKAAEAEHAYRRAVALEERLARDLPDEAKYRIQLADTCTHLALALVQLEKWPEAETCYRRALALQEKLTKDSPTSDNRVRLAGTCVNLGRLLSLRGQCKAALPCFARAIPLLKDVLAHDPQQPTAYQILRSAFASRAEALSRLDRYADAEPDWRRAAEMSQGRARSDLRLQWAKALIRSGRPAEGIGQARELLHLANQEPAAPRSAVLVYNAACIYALAATADARRREAYAARATTILRQARTAGLFSDAQRRTQLNKDADLDALRKRADFKQLLAEMRPKKP